MIGLFEYIHTHAFINIYIYTRYTYIHLSIYLFSCVRRSSILSAVGTNKSGVPRELQVISATDKATLSATAQVFHFSLLDQRQCKSKIISDTKKSYITVPTQ